VIDRRTLLGAGLAGVALGGRALAAAPPAEIVRLPHSGGRITEYRVLFPAKPGKLGLLLFSHGSYASNLDYDLMLQPWAEAGFLCVAPNHIDANTKSPMPANAMPTRIQDMLLVLDQRSVFEDMAKTAGSRLGPQTVASGHSAGGGIARTLAGGKQPDGSSKADPRLSCIVCFSPPGPQFGRVPKDQWSTVKIPAFLQTGTADVIKGFEAPWYDHKTGFEDDKGRGRWLAVGADVDHLFGGLICYRADGPKAEAQRPALTDIVDLSADFMKAYAKGEGGALAKLKTAAAKQTDAPAVTFTSV
jgi:hypothetical protein